MTRGYFGVAVYHPKREINVGTLWRSASAFGAAFVATIGHRYVRQASDTHAAARHTPLMHYRDIADLMDHLPAECPLVGVEQHDAATSLDRFTHPARAVYLLGAEDSGLPLPVMARCDHLLSVPTAVSWPLNVATAGSIVLAHRFIRPAVVVVA